MFPIPPEGRASLTPSPQNSSQRPAQNPRSLKLDNTVVTSHPSKTPEQLGSIKSCQWEIIGDKLTQAGHVSKQFKNYERCGQEEIYRTCACCGKWETMEYQCSLKWCPRCNWKITRRRQEELKFWIAKIEQPKHIVTTQQNRTAFTRQFLRQHQLNLAKLRRTEVFREVKGGCVSVEVTNERKGWHLHAHWLVDARWVDAVELATTWGRIVEQEYAIVKVCDLRHRDDYQKEIAKYVVKSSDMVNWIPTEIREFVETVKANRFFFRFGSLFKLKREKPTREPRICGCGSSDFQFTNEKVELLKQCRARR